MEVASIVIFSSSFKVFTAFTPKGLLTFSQLDIQFPLNIHGSFPGKAHPWKTLYKIFLGINIITCLFYPSVVPTEAEKCSCCLIYTVCAQSINLLRPISYSVPLDPTFLLHNLCSFLITEAILIKSEIFHSKEHRLNFWVLKLIILINAIMKANEFQVAIIWVAEYEPLIITLLQPDTGFTECQAVIMLTLNGNNGEFYNTF